MTRSELLARIYVLLGGRVAEEMIFGDVSTGAQNDLQKATEIARTIITQFGISERLGLVVGLEGPRTPMFLPVPGSAPKEYGEETPRLVDEEIKKYYRKPTPKFGIASPPINKHWRNSRDCYWKKRSLSPSIAGDPERRRRKLW